MNFSQILLGVMTLGALIYTVLAYPSKYGALSGRSRLFRTVGVCLLDLLLMLVLMATFIDFHAGVSARVAPIRFAFYIGSCFCLCFALVSVAALDALESYSSVRRERRGALEHTLRDEIEKARAEFAAKADLKEGGEGSDNDAHKPDAG